LKSLRIGIVAGEVSGDGLGAGLINALRRHYPDLQVEGVCGPQMKQAGCHCLYDMERLAVFGALEILPRYFELRRIHKNLQKHFLKNPPDIFIGVDAPAFNISLEKKLRQAGIKTVQYVSPTVWAWRPKRAFAVEKAADLVLSIFPFEEDFYKDFSVKVKFVGHPLADAIPMETDKLAARQQLGLPELGGIITLMPGSRQSEIKYLAEDFIKTAQYCLQQRANLRFVIPTANQARKKQFLMILEQVAPDLPIIILEGCSREAITAADAVLLASGTATLETLLLKRPMVVAYRLSPISYRLFKPLIKIPYIAQPNILAGKKIVPEFVQNNVVPEKMAKALLGFLDNPEETKSLVDEFTKIHLQLRQDADKSSAQAIAELL